MELGGLGGFLSPKMPQDWLKLGLNSVEKKYVTIIENTTGNSEIQFSPYKLLQPSS